MKLVILVSAVLLSGCATGVNLMAAMYDNNDPCQTWNKPQGYTTPNFCGSSSGKSYVTRDYMTNRAIATTK